MGRSQLVQSYPWQRYSKKLASCIAKPRWVGAFSEKEASERGMRLVVGRDGEVISGNCVLLYWLVDAEDGVIADAKFQAFGQSALLGAAEAACQLVAGKHYARAHRITADAIDTHLRDKENETAFPPETAAHLNLVIGALEMAAEMCAELGLGEGDSLVTPEQLLSRGKEGHGVSNWEVLSKEEKLRWIRAVVEEHIQPYIAMDAGAVEVLDLVADREVLIAYAGACTSCGAATGSTLMAMEQILRSHLHPSLTVVPDPSTLDG